VTLYEKHPNKPSPEMCFVDYGLSSLERTVVERHIPADRDADLAGVYTTLSRSGQLAGLEVRERFYEIGSPEGLRDLEDRLRR
jgi:NDP-sugar pyrophosphorylase family protein